MTVQSPKRGAMPTPRHELAAATPHAVRVGAPPNFITVPAKISMWGNDVHGDCVTAEEAFAKACNNPEIFIPDSDVIAWATRHGVLEGAYLTQVMQWMQNDGFVQDSFVYNDGPYYSVNWTNDSILQSAISQGPVKIGVAANQIETAWRTTSGHTGWFGTGFHSDANEDHCVTLCGYGTLSWLAQQLHVTVPGGIDGSKAGYAMFTWNSIGIIDGPSLLAVTHEAWLRQPTTVTITKSISGNWIGHYSWGCTNNYSQFNITFNANGTFASGSSQGKWSQQDGTLLLSWNNGPAIYGGLVNGNFGAGAMSTFDGSANGCWYLSKQGTVGLSKATVEAADHKQTHNAEGNKV
jgi:hypothetical protein